MERQTITITKKKGISGRPDRIIQWQVHPLSFHVYEIKIVNASSKKDITGKFNIAPPTFINLGEDVEIKIVIEE